MEEDKHKQILNKIAEEVFRSGWLQSECYKLSSDKMLMDDLASEMVLIILEYPNDKMIEAYEKGQHQFLIKRIINNNWNSSTSPFYKKYRKYNDLEIIDDLLEDLTDNDEE